MSTLPDPQKWYEQLLKSFKDVFIQLFQKNPVADQLDEYLSDSNKAYDKYGRRTKEYKQALEECDAYYLDNPVDSYLISAEDSPEMKEMIRSALEMIDERQRVMESYDEEKKKKGFKFRFGDWLKGRLPNGSEDTLMKRVQNDLKQDNSLNQ